MRSSGSTPPGGQEVRLGSRPSAARRLHLALGGVPEAERPQRLRDFFLPLGIRYEAKVTGIDPVEIDIAVEGLPGIQQLSGRMQGAIYRRLRESNDPTEDVGLLLNPGGAFQLGQLSRELVLEDGEATLVSLTDPLEGSHRPPAMLRVLRISRSLLTPSLARGQGGYLRRIPRGTPSLALLAAYIDAAWNERTLTDGGLHHVVVPHFYDLIAVTLGASREAIEVAEGRGLRAARLQAIKRDICAHLNRGDLSISAVADRHRCTERFVQRLFESEGTTFTAFVLAGRLRLAYRLLADPSRRHDKISTVAFDCGFSDVSYFNRMVRRTYGATPSDIRAQVRASEVRAGERDEP